MAYTYLIGWIEQDRWYYGVRYAKKCHQEELWNTYFTSSKHVEQFRRKYGDPDIIQIRKIFNDINKARFWESRVLKRLGAVNDEKWLNKTDNLSICPKSAGHGKTKGKSLTNEHKEKIRKANIGKKLSKEIKIKIANSFKNKSDEEKRTINSKRSNSLKGRIAWNKGINGYHINYSSRGKNNGMFGKTHTIETKLLMRQKKKNKLWVYNQNNGIKLIDVHLLNEYVENDWIIGRPKRKNIK